MDNRRHTDHFPLSSHQRLLRARLAALHAEELAAATAPATPDRTTLIVLAIKRRPLLNVLRSDHQPALGPVLNAIPRSSL